MPLLRVEGSSGIRSPNEWGYRREPVGERTQSLDKGSVVAAWLVCMGTIARIVRFLV